MELTLKSLFPKGWAFRFFKGKFFTLLVEALALEPDRIKSFFIDTRNSGIPGSIPEDALTDWEDLYKLQNITGLTIIERNARIKARYDAVGGQGTDYLEDVLNDQFQDLLIYLVSDTRCGDGESTCGNPHSTCGSFHDESYRAELVIYDITGICPCDTNGILIIKTDNDSRSLTQGLDSDYWNLIWYISGPDSLFSPLQLPIERRNEFIEAVLRIKPTHTWVIAQIEFV